MRAIGLLILTIFFPAFAFAAGLVNINTADAELLDTLPGIGPTYAARIVEYRTVHGQFTRTEDIQNVSGIGPSTYANIAPLITVGSTNAPEQPIVASSTPPVVPASADTTYTPPPATLSVRMDGEQDALVGAPLHLSARVTTRGGAIDPSAQISWSFGDGSWATGTVAEKIYRYAGTYLVVVTAIDGEARARDEITVTVKPAQVRLLPITGDGIMIMNDSNERLDLSDWKLIVDGSSFRIPEGMAVLPKASVLLPYSVTHLLMLSDVMLAYPDGAVAVHFLPAAAPVQPAPAATSYEQVQAVEPPAMSKVEQISSTKTNGQLHEEAVGAPAAATELTVAGAALPPPPASRAAGIFKSPWTLGFLGVIALAGSAFIFL